MAKITYIEHNGKSHTINVDNGLTVMEGAVQNDIPGIDADCGGSMACATCHVYVKEDWLNRVSSKTEGEDDMLDQAYEPKSNSRLSCQLVVSDETEGLSTNCFLKGNDVFSMAIAVAPVTSWRFYDSVYNERYMRTPQENASGYDDNSPINHVEKLKGKYLLVHGSADDNVHYQNTMEMTNALVNANKQFDLFIYPNKNHGIYGGYTRLHLFTKMTNFIKENL